MLAYCRTSVMVFFYLKLCSVDTPIGHCIPFSLDSMFGSDPSATHKAVCDLLENGNPPSSHQYFANPVSYGTLYVLSRPQSSLILLFVISFLNWLC